MANAIEVLHQALPGRRMKLPDQTEPRSVVETVLDPIASISPAATIAQAIRDSQCIMTVHAWADRQPDLSGPRPTFAMGRQEIKRQRLEEPFENIRWAVHRRQSLFPVDV